MKSYSVVHKYTGHNLAVIFARSEKAAKCWFTKNAGQGMSSSYWFYELSRIPLYFGNSSLQMKLELSFKPFAYTGLFDVYVNGRYVGLLDLKYMDVYRDGKQIDVPAGFEYMLTELLDYKYVVTKSSSAGVYNIVNMNDHTLTGRMEISSDLSDIQYYPVSVK